MRAAPPSSARYRQRVERADVVIASCGRLCNDDDLTTGYGTWAVRATCQGMARCARPAASRSARNKSFQSVLAGAVIAPSKVRCRLSASTDARVSCACHAFSCRQLTGAHVRLCKPLLRRTLNHLVMTTPSSWSLIPTIPPAAPSARLTPLPARRQGWRLLRHAGNSVPLPFVGACRVTATVPQDLAQAHNRRSVPASSVC